MADKSSAKKKDSSEDIFPARNSKGVFMDRLATAIRPGDVLTIRHESDGNNIDCYHIEVQTDTHEFGKLRGRESLFVGKATPGGLVRAIEKAKEKITGTIQMMLEAQDNSKE